MSTKTKRATKAAPRWVRAAGRTERYNLVRGRTLLAFVRQTPAAGVPVNAFIVARPSYDWFVTAAATDRPAQGTGYRSLKAATARLVVTLGQLGVKVRPPA
jgi:hypothetical protein